MKSIITMRLTSLLVAALLTPLAANAGDCTTPVLKQYRQSIDACYLRVVKENQHFTESIECSYMETIHSSAELAQAITVYTCLDDFEHQFERIREILQVATNDQIARDLQMKEGTSI